MTQASTVSARGSDRLAAATADDGSPKLSALPAAVEISVVSDTICPWCYVGKRRIEQASKMLADEGVDITVRWLPFELNPNMPAEGLDRREYRSAKFGSWAKSQALDAEVASEGAREGIEFRHYLMARTPNTRLSHRLIWLAGEVGGPGAQDLVVESLFDGYFTQGRDIGDRKVLAEIGFSTGLPVDAVNDLLDGVDGIEEVLNHEMWATRAGLNGVPSVILGEYLLFSGAQRAPLVVDAIRKALGAQAVGQPEFGFGGAADASA